jgi:predicted ArsR family transcriptional regulator
VAEDLAGQIAAVGALADPARRELYRFVAAAEEPVSRDQAAAGVGLARHTVKFHLDRLVDDGLLETEFRRLSGRRGPGAGRPSKLYRRSARQIDVTLPERHYDLPGRILAGGVETAAATGGPVLEAVGEAATAEGRRLAAPGTALPDVLTGLGFEPRDTGDGVVLGNCPFHALATSHTALVCGMNLGMLTALLDERGEDVEASLDPAPGRCCVVLTAGSDRQRGAERVDRSRPGPGG